LIQFNHIQHKIALLIGAIFLLNNVSSQSILELLPGSDRLVIDKAAGYQKLIGNVKFKYQGHLMYCDSAFFYDKLGEVYAYGHVKINKKDSLNLLCDSLYYNSKTEKAKLWGNVRVHDDEFRLTTDTLDYDAKLGAAIYRHGGTITHLKRKDKLTSKIGYYYPESKNFFFRKNVVYKDENYHILTDTMRFQSANELLYFYGNTKIDQPKDSTTIYFKRGFFDLKNNSGEFIDSAVILKPRQSIMGDTLRYSSVTELFIGKGNVVVRDSVEQMEFRGHHVISNDKTRSKRITDNALAILFQKNDTTYIHADTLFSMSDTLSELAFMQAYYGVKIYSTAYQMRCDSLSYTKEDSLMKFYNAPILWTKNTQLAGDFISIKRFKDEIKHAQVLGKATALSELDSGKYFNQVAGREIDAYFIQNDLNLLHVQGNAKTIYYPESEKENDTSVVVTRNGMNRLMSSELKLYLDSGEVVGVTNIDAPDGVFYGMNSIPEKEKRVDNFSWRNSERPDAPVGYVFVEKGVVEGEVDEEIEVGEKEE
jgi:lipopolysaccharide export system protein LptA